MTKLAILSGGHNAEVLTGSAVQFISRKHSNEYVYYSVDAFGRAIHTGHKATFLFGRIFTTKIPHLSSDKCGIFE